MSDAPKPLARYRIHCENKALYYTVYVWRTLKDLRTYCPGNSHALGLCRTWDRLRVFGKRDKRPNRKLPECGEVHFCQFHLRIGIITHEFTHATIGWAARTGIIPNFDPIRSGQYETLRRRSNEERFCYVLGNMVKEFIRRAYDDGVICQPTPPKNK